MSKARDEIHEILMNLNRGRLTVSQSYEEIESKFSELEQQNEIKDNIIGELNNDNINLKQQKAELIDVMERIRGLCKSKAVNNNIDQIFLIADIALNKLQKEN